MVANGGRQIQVALNGDGFSPLMPRTPSETARQAAASVAAGATSIHLHAFDDDGNETLDGVHVARTLTEVRRLCPNVPINMTTFAAIEPDPVRRSKLIRGWTVVPDLIPANQGETGIDEIAADLSVRGVGVEACVLDARDVQRFLSRGNWGRYERIFVEPMLTDPAQAAESALAMSLALVRGGCDLEQVHHGVGMATWAVIRQAGARGHGVRIGLEDTELLPNGETARGGNVELVEAVVAEMNDLPI